MDQVNREGKDGDNEVTQTQTVVRGASRQRSAPRTSFEKRAESLSLISELPSWHKLFKLFSSRVTEGSIRAAATVQRDMTYRAQATPAVCSSQSSGSVLMVGLVEVF